jgi:hypothetical protein
VTPPEGLGPRVRSHASSAVASSNNSPKLGAGIPPWCGRKPNNSNNQSNDINNATTTTTTTTIAAAATTGTRTPTSITTATIKTTSSSNSPKLMPGISPWGRKQNNRNQAAQNKNNPQRNGFKLTQPQLHRTRSDPNSPRKGHNNNYNNNNHNHNQHHNGKPMPINHNRQAPPNLPQRRFANSNLQALMHALSPTVPYIEAYRVREVFEFFDEPYVPLAQSSQQSASNTQL